MNARINGVAILLASFTLMPALAQTSDAPQATAQQQKNGKEMLPIPAGTSAVETGSMAGMDHGKMMQAAPAGMADMDHGKMMQTTPAAMPGMDHGKMMPAAASPMSGMDHGEMKSMGSAASPESTAAMPGMDHGEMKSQSNSAPADARDPHAYADGNTLDAGIYALPAGQRLRLADESNFASFLVNRIERSNGPHSNATAYDAQAWFGRDYDRVLLKAEGEVSKGRVQESRTELLWGHAIAPFWDTQLGLRYDGGTMPGQGWLAMGVQGIAPYWFEIDATAYIGNNGKTALRLGAEYEILLTQKLILQPSLGVDLFGKRDVARDIGRGFSSATAGLRLRYEISRQFAPYVGIEHRAKFGETAELMRAAGERATETRWVAGARIWF